MGINCLSIHTAQYIFHFVAVYTRCKHNPYACKNLYIHMEVFFFFTAENADPVKHLWGSGLMVRPSSILTHSAELQPHSHTFPERQINNPTLLKVRLLSLPPSTAHTTGSSSAEHSPSTAPSLLPSPGSSRTTRLCSASSPHQHCAALLLSHPCPQCPHNSCGLNYQNNILIVS